MAKQRKYKKDYQFRPTTENIPARKTRWMYMFIGSLPKDELRSVFKIGTVNEKTDKFCSCDYPIVRGVMGFEYCGECNKDL